MIDTIHLNLHPDHIPPDYLSFLNYLIPDLKPYGKENIVYLGMHKNLDVVYNIQGLYIKNSLAVYRFGTNQKTLNLSDIKETITALSDEFQVPLMNSKVNRLDIAENIVTDHKPDLYFKIIESGQRLERIGMPDGVELRNTKRSLGFYDKIKEQRKKRKPITTVLWERNVLRYEYRYKNHQTLAAFLKLPKVYMSDVITNYDKLVASWADNFLKINTNHHLLIFKPEAFNKKGAFIKQMQILGIEAAGGVQGVYNIIDNAKAEGWYKQKHESSNQKKWVRDTMKAPGLTELSDLASELEKKITWIKLINADHLSPSLDFDTGIMT